MNKYTIGNNEMTITLPLDALTAQLKMQGLTLLLDHELPAFNLAASPQPDAGGEIEKIKQTFENIIKWCEESGIKDCDISNKQHMAIYHSLHLSRNALATLPTREPEGEGKV